MYYRQLARYIGGANVKLRPPVRFLHLNKLTDLFTKRESYKAWFGKEDLELKWWMLRKLMIHT